MDTSYYPSNTKPLVVLDWGWIRSRESGGEYLSSRANYLIADTVFSEMFGAVDTGGAGFMLKLKRLLIRNDRRVFGGRYWADISAEEEPPQRLASWSSVVCPEMTKELRRVAHSPESVWKAGASFVRDVREEHEGKRREFVALCSQWTEWVTENSPESVRTAKTDPAVLVDWICQPSQIAGFMQAFNPRMKGDCWNSALSVFPDRLAAGRWARIVGWYAMQHSVGKTSGFANNWEDSHYAFLASYTGFLATNDSGLKEAVRVVYPAVRFWPDDVKYN